MEKGPTLMDQQIQAPGQRAAQVALEINPPSHETIIAVEGLEKQYPRSPVKAVNGISFSVKRGEVFGLLGPNGAGKTTTIGVLTTRVQPTGGRATVAGVDVVGDPVGLKPHIAVVPQRNNLDRSLTAIENLTFHAAYFGMGRRERQERALAVLKEFGLGERAKDKVDKYSGGMAQRLMIARALMHAPSVLFLDEPTTGLDPQARLFLWEMIEALNHNGLTVLLTTHDMEEAEKLCHRVAIMDHGKILALDTPKNLGALVPAGTRVELRVRASAEAPLSDEGKALILDAVRNLPGVTEAEWTTARSKTNAGVAGPPAWMIAMMAGAKGKPGAGASPATMPGAQAETDEPMIRLYAERSGEIAVKAAQILLDAGLELADLHLAQPSLEDVFIHLTGKGLRD
ncbi:MAG TPA: ATP-binding cassette domain-containing protein [Blastocatellia bacterium]|nr:ATP-binding cassette domain-containing protein [Blastocatellia bacterium]